MIFLAACYPAVHRVADELMIITIGFAETVPNEATTKTVTTTTTSTVVAGRLCPTSAVVAGQCFDSIDLTFQYI